MERQGETDFLQTLCRWRNKQNFARVDWNVQSVPTLVRFEDVDGKVRETGRLVEGEILDEKKLKGLLSGRS